MSRALQHAPPQWMELLILKMTDLNNQISMSPSLYLSFTISQSQQHSLSGSLAVTSSHVTLGLRLSPHRGPHAQFRAVMLRLLLCLAALAALTQATSRYQPNWASLDKRPLPAWYDDSKVGIFLHWGVFSVPSFRSEWFWWYWKGTQESDVVNFMKRNYRPGFSYADFAPMFTAELFNPDQWADIFKASGAKYVVLTTKHHEGFCNWPTNVSFNWNARDTGPHRDLVGDLAASIRKRTDIHFGVYHSLFEWFNPLFNADKQNGFKSRTFVDTKSLPELYELVNTYRPEVIWSDGDAASVDYWNSTDFLAWLYNDSPVKDTVVTNDRWGSGTACKHGGFYTCQDRYNPGKLVNHKWENAMTIDRRSWGFRREAVLADYLSIEDLLSQLVSTVSCGGNILINVGPTHDGRIVPIFEERLRQLGAWLGVNGVAIYGSRPWRHQNDTAAKDVWYTVGKDGAVYATLLEWPAGGRLFLGAPRLGPHAGVQLLGSGPVPFKPASNGVIVLLPQDTGLRWAWSLRITGERLTQAPKT
ncbi:MAG: alpha-L-fucosidase [Pseudomonadota bacterium]